MLESIILVLTLYWFLSFSPQAIAPSRTQAGYLTDVLSVVIVVLIAIRFLF